MTMRNAFDDLASEKSLKLLTRIFQLLKPLGMVTGGGSNRLSVDINSSANLNVSQATAANLNCTATIAANQTVANVTTVGNQAQMGGVTAFEMMKALSRSGYNTGVRSRIT